MDKNKELKDYLRLHYSTQNTNDIAIRFNTTADNIRHMASRLKLRKKCNNDIVDDYKLCSTCKKMLPVSDFYKDKYQRNNLRYECISCFKSGNNKNKDSSNDNSITTPPFDYCHNDRGEGLYYCDNDSKKRLDYKRNPIVYMDGKAGLVCKECNHWKELNEYQKDSRMISGHINICRVCDKARRSGKSI